jgi:hypothetical protein
MSLIPGEPPLVYAPSVGDRQHVPFVGVGDVELLADAEFGPETKLAASSLFDAYRSVRLRQWVRKELGLGWALDPQLRLLQLDDPFVGSRRERDRQRLENQRVFLSEAVGGADLLGEDLTRAAASEIAEAFLDLERGAWATALIVPALAHLDDSPRVLRNNLALLEAAIDYFQGEGLDAVADDQGSFAKSRQLFAAIPIHARLLRDATFVRYLRESYSELSEHLYGYWVQIPNLTSDAPPGVIRGLSDLVYPLQDHAETNVVLDRVGPFGLGYLANGIAGDCMGTSAPEFITHPPTSYRRELRPGEEETGFTLVVYNQVLLRNRQMTGRHRVRGERAYRHHPCGECGYHEPDKPPLGNRAKKLHGFYWHRIQTRKLGYGAVADTRQHFMQMLQTAEKANARLGEDGSYYESLRETMRPEAATGFGDPG